jgi:hypothetical protein
VSDAYQYPLSTQQLAEIEDQVKKVELLAVPTAELERISTAGLVETVLGYPYFSSAFLFNTPQMGIDSTIRSLGSYQELVSRSDAADKLLAVYQRAELAKIIRLSEFPTLEFPIFEGVLCQDEVLQQLDAEGRRQLLQLAVKNYGLKEHEYADIFSSNSSTLRLILKTLYFDDSDFAALARKYPDVTAFMETGFPAVNSEEDLDRFWDEAAELLLKHGYGQFLEQLG